MKRTVKKNICRIGMEYMKYIVHIVVKMLFLKKYAVKMACSDKSLKCVTVIFQSLLLLF